MTDVVSPDVRSRMMSGIGPKNTRPEILVRKGLHHRGFRYGLHNPQLPGKPDLVLRKYNAVILVHGCFWHGHECHLFKWPRTRPDFWRDKITGNRKRDSRNLSELASLGWRVLVIWECSLKGKCRLGLDEVIDLTENWIQSTSMIGNLDHYGLSRTFDRMNITHETGLPVEPFSGSCW